MTSIIILVSLVFYLVTSNISETSYAQKATFLNMYQCEQVQVEDQVCVPKTDKTVGLFEETEPWKD